MEELTMDQFMELNKRNSNLSKQYNIDIDEYYRNRRNGIKPKKPKEPKMTTYKEEVIRLSSPI